jgi:hypothetical protein
MQQLLQVLTATFVIPGVLLAAVPGVAADDGVVLVACDLFSQRGPTVAFVQSHGLAGSDSARRFVSSPGSGDLEGSDCAEILSGAIDDGLEFQAMEVFGEQSELALWFFRED